MNTAEYLKQLIDCKEDMKSAIEERGITITGGLSTYADLIREIQWRQEGKIRYAHNTWEYCPDIDISKYTSLDDMFRECVNLIEGPNFDTKNINDFSYMFFGCVNLTSVPLYDMSNAQSVYAMFMHCSNLTSVPLFDFSNVRDIGFLFCDCSSLTSVPLLDFKNVTRVTNTFKDCYNLINLGGFKDFGAKENLYSDGSPLNLISCDKLTHESIMNVINNLYDRKTAGYSVLTLKLHANTLALLSDEEKAIATNKGWTLS